MNLLAVRTPFFSVVMPARNRERQIGRALGSVLAQDYDDFELIVVDDGSSDRTVEVVEALADSRIITLKQSAAGVSAARNRGARMAGGVWLTFIDSDDEALPGWLGRLFELTAGPSVGVACVGIEAVNSAGQYAGTASRVTPRPLGPMFGGRTGLFLAGSFAVQKQLFLDVGGYEESLAYSENTELGMRLMRMCQARSLECSNTQEICLRYFLGQNVHDPRFLATRRLESARLLLEKHAAAFAADRRMEAVYWSVAGVAAIKLGQTTEGRDYLRQAVKCRPLGPVGWMRLAAAAVPSLARRVWRLNTKGGREGKADA